MARHVLSLLKSHRNFLLVAVGCIALVTPAFEQTSVTPPEAAGGRTFAYDVVSVHPCKLGSGMSIQSHPDGFSARCTTLWGLMYNAYAVRPNDSIPGLPGWANSEQFDVEAKMDDATLASLKKLPPEQYGEQRQRMLQAILVERFGLKTPQETREQPIYALVIAKGGPKLIAGEKAGGTSWGGGRIETHGAPIERLAFTLSDVLGRVVVDKTGLTGKYDVELKWTPDEQQVTADAGPTLFTAIQEQLGLKLEPAKGPVDTFVVDQVEKPTEN